MSEIQSDPVVEYRPVPGFPMYRVGSDGSVWSRHRRSNKTPNGLWRKLKPHIDSAGRPTILLYPGHLTTFPHHLVLEAFVGPCPDGMECCHFPDRDPTNNNLSNLRWGTHQSNMDDKKAHGTHQVGEKHGMAKLTEQDVLSIRSEYTEKKTSYSKLATRYKVRKSLIGMIINRQTWKNI